MIPVNFQHKNLKQIILTSAIKMVGHKLEKNSYTVRERTQLDNTPNKYDVYDPESEEIVLLCIEEDFDMFNTHLRMHRFNTFTPFQIGIFSTDGERLYVLRRHPDILHSKVAVTDADGLLWLSFNELNPATRHGVVLEIFDRYDKIIYKVTNEDNTYLLFENNHLIGKIFHKKMKMPKNNILMIDNYIVDIQGEISIESPVRLVLLLTSVCLDILFFDGIDI